MKMKPDKKVTNSDVASDYAKSGKRMVMQPKPGESAKKNLTVGRSSTMVNNGVYVPKPTAAAKAPVKAVKATKSNFKSPSSRQTGMKQAMKKGGKGPRCK